MPPLNLILYSLLALTSLTQARSIIPAPKRIIPSVAESYREGQQILSSPPKTSIPYPQHPTPHYDAQENSVGVLFTTDEGEVKHFWLPLGKKVFTRDSPLLPLHPTSARVTNLIHTTPSLAAPEELDRIQCDIWTAYNRTRGRGKGVPEKWRVSFSRRDGPVKFTVEEHGRHWLGGKEVESYECRS